MHTINSFPELAKKKIIVTGSEENDFETQDNVFSELIVKVFSDKKNNTNDSFSPSEFMTIEKEVRKRVLKLHQLHLPQKEIDENQIDRTIDIFLRELQEYEFGNPTTSYHRAMVKCVKEKSTDYLTYIDSYSRRVLFTYFKKYAKPEDKDYISFHDSVKDRLDNLERDGKIKSKNIKLHNKNEQVYYLTGEKPLQILNSRSFDRKLLDGISFSRKQNDIKVSNPGLSKAIDTFVGRLSDYMFMLRDVTEIFFSFTNNSPNLTTEAKSTEDEFLGKAEEIADPQQEIERIEKIIETQIKIPIDPQRASAKLTRTRAKYRLIFLGYLATQSDLTQNEIFVSLSDEHKKSLTPPPLDYVNRIINFLDNLQIADSSINVKAERSSINLYLKQINDAVASVIDNMTVIDQQKVIAAYAKSLIRNYLSLTGGKNS